MYETFYVDKASGTFADVLTVYGLARLLSDLLRGQEGADEEAGVRLRDDGPAYRLTCTPALDDEVLSRVPRPLLPGVAKVVQTAKNAQGLPANLGDAQYMVDYEAERDRRRAYLEAIGNITDREARRALAQGEHHPALQALPDRPHQHWDIFRAVNPGALIGYNALLLNWWAAQGALPDVLRLILTLYTTSPNTVFLIQPRHHT